VVVVGFVLVVTLNNILKLNAHSEQLGSHSHKRHRATTMRIHELLEACLEYVVVEGVLGKFHFACRAKVSAWQRGSRSRFELATNHHHPSSPPVEVHKSLDAGVM
jgi:metal-responsive CopG/Arc/MetJ family transcriptional regulator